MKDKNYTQLCVWQGVLLDGFTTKEFEDYMLERFGTRIIFETEIRTLPDLDRKGNPITKTGGRNDVFFYVHKEDIPKFAVLRLNAGIRWWEDVFCFNTDNSHLYPQEFIKKYKLCW
jgi:hypothetical protein